MKRLLCAILSVIITCSVFTGFGQVTVSAEQGRYNVISDLNSYDYNNAKSEIERHDVISFDIFDTLLVRPYVEPEDLFIHLEKLQNDYGYTKDNPDGRGSTLEESILQPQTENVELFNYAKSLGKKVLIISDMYLHEDFLSRVLEKNGIQGWDKIYVSSDIGLDKYSGKLFDYVLNDLSITPQTMLHIGDNLYSDGVMANSRGIDYFYTPKLIDRLFAKYPRCKKYYNEHKNELTASMFLGTASLNMLKHKDDYWYNFGYLYGGPILYSYTKWLSEEFEKDEIKDAVFVARDGYNLKKIFELINENSDIKSHYLYASRKIVNKYFNATGEDREHYQSYIDSLGISSGNVACIDSCACFYSSLRLMLDYLPDNNVKGYYYTLFGNNPEYSKSEFSNRALSRIINWDIMEFYMSDPVPKIIDVNDNQPVYADTNEYEDKRIAAEIPMYDGILDFARDAENSFKDINLCVDSAQVDIFSNILYRTIEPKDNVYLDQICHSPWNNNLYISIFKIYENPIIKDGTYVIESALDKNKVVDIYGASLNNGAKTILWDKNNGNNQKFEVTYNNGRYNIKAKHSGKYLRTDSTIDFNSESHFDSSNIYQNESKPIHFNEWYLEPTEDGYYNIISKFNGLYMDVCNSETKNGTIVRCSEKNGKKSQKFRLVKANNQVLENGTYVIASAIDNKKVLDIAKASKNNFANLQLWSRNNTNAQKFKVTYNNDGTYTMEALCSKKVIDVMKQGKSIGTNISQYKRNGTKAQKWNINPAGGGYYNIIAKCNGLCMDVAQAKSKNGTNIRCWRKNGTKSQKFKFIKV